MKATLRYGNGDKRKIWDFLTSRNMKAVNSDCFKINEEVIIEVENYDELNNIANKLNEISSYGVNIVEVVNEKKLTKLELLKKLRNKTTI